MTRLHRKLEYALMALKLMAGKPAADLTSATEVSEKLRTPYEVTARVMQALAQAQVLESEHGAQGGYRLKKDLNKLSLLNIIEIIDGPQNIVKCIEGKKQCDIHASCNISDPLAHLNIRVNEFYASIPLSEVVHG